MHQSQCDTPAALGFACRLRVRSNHLRPPYQLNTIVTVLKIVLMTPVADLIELV